MKPLFYIIRKSMKNYIKDLKKKPAALIAYILWAVLLIAVIVMSILDKSPSRKSMLSKEMYSTIMGMAILTFTYMNIKFSMSRGQTFFRMSDVNMVFTSPISPKKVLLYGFLKEVKGILFMLMFVLFQIPTMKSFFPISRYGISIIFLGIFIFIFFMSIVGVLLYSIYSKSEQRKKNLDRVMNVVIGIFIAVFLIKLFQIKDVKMTAITIFNSKYFLYIPFIGWFQGLFNGAVNGANVFFYIYLILILSSTAILMYALYKSDTEYYEDVLSSTEYVEDVYKARKEGKTLSPKKVRKIKMAYKAEGVKAIFYRQILEYKKTGILFLDKGTLVMVLSGIVFGFFVDKGNINAVLYFTAYMLLFTTAQGKWSQELTKPYIYLIPGKSWSKVFYATLADNIKNLVNGLVLFTTVGIIFRTQPIILILCVLSYTSFGCVYIYGDVLGRRLFGGYSKTLGVLLKILITILIVSPGITGFIIISIIYKDIIIMKYLSYGLLIGYNVLASLALLFLNKGIFENLEMQ